LAVPGLVILLSISLTLDTVALTWGAISPVTTSRNVSDTTSLVTTTGSVFHALYQEAQGGLGAIRYRRTANAGLTWTASTVLSSSDAVYVYGAAMAARGSALDAVWIEQRGSTLALVYRRSTDAGATWSTRRDLAGATAMSAPRSDGPVVLSESVVRPVEESATGASDPALERPRPTADRRLGLATTTSRTLAVGGTSPSYPAVVHDSSNRVVVSWTNDASGAIYVRRSTDSGVTWKAPVSIDTTTNQPVTGGFYDGLPNLAAGTGVMYLVFYKTAANLRVRRSTDGGATWSGATSLASNGSGYFPVVSATGSSAVVGYAVWAPPYLYSASRRTTDKGATWKPVVNLDAPTGNPSFQPRITRGGSRWHAIYERCIDAACATSATYHRSSADGATWTTPSRLSASPREYESPGGLAYADRLGALFVDDSAALLDSDLFFVAGS
jgi:hypothetical protein